MRWDIVLNGAVHTLQNSIDFNPFPAVFLFYSERQIYFQHFKLRPYFMKNLYMTDRIPGIKFISNINFWGSVMISDSFTEFESFSGKTLCVSYLKVNVVFFSFFFPEFFSFSLVFLWSFLLLLSFSLLFIFAWNPTFQRNCTLLLFSYTLQEGEQKSMRVENEFSLYENRIWNDLLFWSQGLSILKNTQ